jgi:hypothetical protein
MLDGVLTLEHFYQVRARRVLQPIQQRSQKRKNVGLYPRAYPLSIILRRERYAL